MQGIMVQQTPIFNLITIQKKNIQQIKPWLYRPKKSKFGTRRNTKYNDQHWTQQENIKYINFIKTYIDLVKSDSNQKRKYHLNRMLSKFVGTRSPIQCRSHHQRMIKTYGDPQTIVLKLTEIIQSSSQALDQRRSSEFDLIQQDSLQLMLFPEIDLNINRDTRDDMANSDISLQMFDSEEMFKSDADFYLY